MMVYGFTRVCSEGDYKGRRSETRLFTIKEERDRIMYKDYAETFDDFVGDGTFEDEVDADGKGKMTEDEFRKKLLGSDGMEHDVFGLILTEDKYIQYEPFAKCVN